MTQPIAPIIERSADGHIDRLPSEWPALLRRLYRYRGIEQADALDYRLAALPNPAGLSGTSAAAERLADAVMQGERILVVGDFDADGATSTAVAVRALRALGAEAVDYLVPNRFDFGYGLSAELVEVARQREPNLILTVDNGISSHAGVAAANAVGIGVVITDHHLPGDSLPLADAIVNPQVDSAGFAAPHLAGVGVCFYTMLAVRGVLRQRGWFNAQRPEPALTDLLDLVALGTVADVVTLDHVNRLLVEQGLRRLRAGKGCPGVLALLEVAGRDPEQACAMDLGFAAAPRLNAAGRLGDMAQGIEALLSEDIEQARHRAQALEALNRERRAIEQEMRSTAMAEIQADQIAAAGSLDPILCVFDPNWHQGIVGIVAGRVKEHFQRPVIAFAPGENGELKGSGRSLAGLHMRDLLEAVDTQTQGQVITRFGGHAMAAGLSVPEDQFEAFRRSVLSIARAWLGDQPPGQTWLTDGELSVAELTLETARMLRFAGPWGAGFVEPCFHGRFHVLERRWVGGSHLKLVIAPIDHPQHRIEGIAFNAAHRGWDTLGDHIHGVYRLDVNRFRGREQLQLLFDELQSATQTNSAH